MKSQLIPILLFSFLAFAQSPDSPKWTLTTSDFKTEAVSLTAIDASGIKVSPADSSSSRTVPLTEFLELQRPLTPVANTAKFTLRLAGGDKLAGEPANLTAEALVWKNPTLGEIAIPTANLVGFSRNAPSNPAIPEQGREDVITLANGDTVKGILASMSRTTATVSAGANNTDVPLDSVATVSFAATPGATAPKHGFRVRLDEGSSLVGSEARLDKSDLVLTLAKNTERKISLAHVAAIEQLNGPVSWLSSRAPATSLYYPFIGPAKEPAAYFDRQFSSPNPIQFKGKQYPHGIGVHAFSRLTWNIEPGYSSFRTLYAVEGDSSLADVTVRIKLDDKVVHEQQHVHAGVLSAPVVIDLKNARTLTLEVDGGPAYAQDSLDWIEPALLKTPG